MDELGLLAGTLTTVSFVPQVLKIYRSKQAQDVSTPMFLIFTAGVMCWFAYGWSIQSQPIMITNSVTWVLCVAVLVLKWRYRHRAR